MLRHATLLLLAAVAAPVLADTRLEYVDEKTGDTQTVISIRDGKVRIDDTGSGAFTLFDAESGSLTTVDTAAKSYTVMDKAAQERMSGEVGSMMAEMRKQLEQMPPEQRAMMEKMMGDMPGMNRKPVEVKVDRTGRKHQRAGHDCEQVFFSVGTLGRTELCVVDTDELRIRDADLAALNAMQEQLQKMAESLSQASGMDLTFDMETIGGIAVYSKTDKDDSADVLESVSDAALDASLFQVPKGYEEEKVEFGE